MRNLVDELHHQFARWLCLHYSAILLPKFSPKEVSRRKGLPPGKRRVIDSNSVRKLAQIAPFRFCQFLLHKTREFPGTKVIICDER